MGALLGAQSCGRCGAPRGDGGSWCQRCGVRVIDAGPGASLGTYSGLLSGVQLAAPSRRRIATFVDMVPVLLVAVTLGIALAVASRYALVATLSGGVILIAYAVIHLTLGVRTGRSLGRALLSLRTVDDLTGEPASLAEKGSGRMPFLQRRHTIVADLRRGRDPLRMALPAADRILSSASSGLLFAATATPTRGSHSAAYEPSPNSPSIVLVLDTGERLDLVSSVLIGRAPVNAEGQEHPLFAWPDLGRSLTKTHALLEWSGAVLWVTDLDSVNGTSLISPDGIRQPLMPGLRGPAAPGYTIAMGERSMQVHPSGVLAESAPPGSGIPENVSTDAE